MRERERELKRKRYSAIYARCTHVHDDGILRVSVNVGQALVISCNWLICNYLTLSVYVCVSVCGCVCVCMCECVRVCVCVCVSLCGCNVNQRNMSWGLGCV